MRIILPAIAIVAALIIGLVLGGSQLRAEEKPDAELAYQTARADAAEARVALAEATNAINVAQLQAASATIVYLQKAPGLQATVDVTTKALEALKAKQTPPPAK